MDPALLELADARVRAELPYVTSLLVVRGGDLVFEAYYGGFADPNQTVQIWSATKSFTSTGVGIAIDEGLLRLDQTVGELIPDRIPAGADPRSASVTVEQLLAMTSGFAWNSPTDYQFAFDEVDIVARTLGLSRAEKFITYELRRQELAAYAADTTRVISYTNELLSVSTVASTTMISLLNGTTLPEPGQTVTDAITAVYSQTIDAMINTTYARDLQALQDALDQLIEDGTYADILEEWNLAAGAIE